MDDIYLDYNNSFRLWRLSWISQTQSEHPYSSCLTVLLWEFGWEMYSCWDNLQHGVKVSSYHNRSVALLNFNYVCLNHRVKILPHKPTRSPAAFVPGFDSRGVFLLALRGICAHLDLFWLSQ
ncbi:hypothetical protein BDN70DRAFT_88699 [Pholiota conissans]|uniref:Uncharacterized protein n=1 Tax=Pholiota conissans TaxID=109636 RepID=A0A9P5Z1M3_9AGAR|nr:hypothetical protein BDN70DRAFT_88699 [Pholiota conissans]